MIFRTNRFPWCAGLVVLSSIPGAAGAQTIEITAIGGSYGPSGSVFQANGDICDEPCPEVFVPVSLRSGAMFGGKLAVRGTSGWGFEAMMQRGRVARQRVAGSYGASEDVTVTFLAVQTHLGLRLNDVFELGALAGPAGSLVRVVSNSGAEQSGLRGGLAVSASLRAHVRPFVFEFRATSYSHYMTAAQVSDRRDVTLGFGMGYVFERGPRRKGTLD